MILRRLLLAGSLLLAGIVSARSDGPTITAKKFDNEPVNLFYFEDTDTILVQDSATGNVHISRDAGGSWSLAGGDDTPMKGNVATLRQHPFDKKKAYALSTRDKHWVTDDVGKTWREFEVGKPLNRKEPLVFHGKNSEKVLIQAEECLVGMCEAFAYYTTDDFKTIHAMIEGHLSCAWAIGSPNFGDGIKLEPKIDNRVFCVAPGLHSLLPSDFRLLYSDTFFKEDKGFEAPLSNGRAVSGVVHTVGVQRFLLAAATSSRTDELALYVTDDAVTWHRAEFGSHKIEEDAYTIMESTNYSVQIAVLTDKGPNPMGILFTSNSNGTYYSRNAEHVNIDPHRTVDFEDIAGVQGIILVNVVKNWKDLEGKRGDNKEIISQISFDDGRTFHDLKVGDDKLHLHSYTELTNSGRVFSSPAPGLLMGVGNTGDHLKGYLDGNLYVSSDAGLTWRKALDEAHKYEVGDQGSVLVAVFDEERTDKISYSINHGKDWKTAELPHKVRAKLLTTTPDSTSLKFILVGSEKKGSEGTHYVFTIDFSDMHERKCGDDDFEKWPARLDEKGQPDCLMGHKQFYRRRKADADCFVGNSEFKEPEPEFESCKCTEEDFECDFNFRRTEDRKSCEPVGKLSVPEGECKKPEDEYLGSSGWRLIPGNKCTRNPETDLDKPKKRPCSEAKKTPVSGDIAVEKTTFKAEQISQYLYIERAESGRGSDETIVMLTSKQEVFMTRDHGKSWKRILEGKDIIEMVPHRYFNDAVYFITATNKAYFTINRGESFDEFEVKDPPTKGFADVLYFHPQHSDWLIWSGAADCPSDVDCSTAYYSKDRGAEWHLLRRYVKKCEFLGMEGRKDSDKLVLCAQYEGENPKSNRVKLLSSDDWFDRSEKHFDNILNFATAGEFVVVAARDKDDKSLKVDASVDGKIYADAQFPSNFKVEVQQAYTVLPVTTHAVFLHVTVNDMADHEYGTILKSNSNGTFYVTSLHGVNRDRKGYVDFERMQGLEGVLLVNVVANVPEVDKGSPKKLKSMITHNDGSEWDLIPPPEKDSEGRAFDCSTKHGKPTDKCSLHLHAFTERRDLSRDTFSSGSAIGLMIANGNVGEYLTQKSEANTYITRDGGITWHEIKKGNYMWEYGDQGSVIVIVPESKATKSVLYTLDEGETWKEFQFTDAEMQIDDISTVPSDTSMNFLLWGKEIGAGSSSGVITVNLDFSGIKERARKCVLQEEHPKDDDYDLWEPKHPKLGDKCLFGHVSQYHRKRPEKECFNGRETQHLDHIQKNCPCTMQDYECDYNYERRPGGSCEKVPGLPDLDPKRVCIENPNALEWYDPTGYRRIPLTTCDGGLQLDRLTAHDCPGKVSGKHTALSGFAIFFIVLLCLGLAGTVGWYVSTRWDGKFGRIRLGEPGSDGLLSRDSPLVSIPITVVAGTVAVLSAIPLLATSLWRSARGYIRIPGRAGQRPYASRAAFAARRGDYEGVVPDEDELLGVDEFEDESDDV